MEMNVLAGNLQHKVLKKIVRGSGCKGMSAVLKTFSVCLPHDSHAVSML